MVISTCVLSLVTYEASLEDQNILKKKKIDEWIHDSIMCKPASKNNGCTFIHVIKYI